MNWVNWLFAVATILIGPIMMVLAVYVAFEILSAILPFVLGFTFGIGLVSCVMAMAIMHLLEE